MNNFHILGKTRCEGKEFIDFFRLPLRALSFYRDADFLQKWKLKCTLVAILKALSTQAILGKISNNPGTSVSLSLNLEGAEYQQYSFGIFRCVAMSIPVVRTLIKTYKFKDFPGFACECEHEKLV